MPRPNRLAKLLACAVILASGALTACGDGSDSSGSDSSSGSDTTGAAAGTSSADALETAYKGVTAAPPTEAAAPSTGLVWVVSCGQSVETCATPANSAVEAAETAGFEGKVCDGKLNPQGWSECIRQGISAQAVGIVVIGQDCASFSAALEEAKAANIPTIGSGGNDCDVSGGEKLFAATQQQMPDMTNQEWWESMGALQADWLIGKTDGKAQVLALKFTDAMWGGWMYDGLTKELETCSGCEVVETLELGNQDVASGQLTQKFSTALLKQPSANAVAVPLDGWFFAGLAQAVKSSGRNDDLQVVGTFGEPGNMQFIAQNGGEDASVGFSAEWSGWAGVDTLIRVLDSQEPQPAGVGLQVIDADNNMPEGDARFSYNPVIDFKAAYKTAWGVS